ncbi:MAG: Rieske 2Fe-2S domain-containing protein [Bacteroidia bacterium]
MFFRKKEIYWFLLFSSEEKAIENLPLNKVVAIEVDSKELCIARHDTGYFVTNSKCPHQGLPLNKGGFCEKGNIICPFHRYEWDMRTGRESRMQENNMEVYPVKLDEKGLWVGIEKKKGGFFSS